MTGGFDGRRGWLDDLRDGGFDEDSVRERVVGEGGIDEARVDEGVVDEVICVCMYVCVHVCACVRCVRLL